MSARSQRVEVITRGERRRRWSVEQKREIAAESLEVGVSPITVARRDGISSGQLYTWRRHLLEGSLGTSAQTVARFARVDVMAAPTDPVATPSSPQAAPASSSTNHPAGRVGAPMIALHSDVRVYLACGYTDMRKGMQGLAMLVQQVLAEDPFNGALYASRGRRGNLLKLVCMTALACAHQAVGARSLHLADDEHGLDRAIGRAAVDAVGRLRVASDGAQSEARAGRLMRS